jgi:hypothetical protein
MLPDGILAIALSAILPFLLFGLLLETSDISMMMRKACWGAMGAAFLGMWIYRWGEIGDIGYIYLAMAIAALAVLWFNGQIHFLFALQKVKNKQSQEALTQYIKVNHEISELKARYMQGIAEHVHRGILADAEEQIKEKQKVLNALYKELKQ